MLDRIVLGIFVVLVEMSYGLGMSWVIIYSVSQSTIPKAALGIDPISLRTFEGMSLPPSLVKVLVPGETLPQELLSRITILVLMLMPPPNVLVVVEYGGADRLLCPILTDDIVIDPLLEVARIEVRHPYAGLFEHGPAASL